MALLAALLLAVAACGGPESGERPDDRKEAERSDAETVEQRQEDAQAAFDEADRRIDEIGARMDEDAQAALQETFEALQRRRDTLRQDLDLLKASGEGRTDASRGELQRRITQLARDSEALHLQALPSPDAFAQGAEDRLNRLDATISRLGRDLSRIDSEARADYREAVADLQVRYDSLRQQVARVRSTSEQQFEAMRPEIANRLATLRADVRQMAEEIEAAARDGQRGSQ